ncbi:MAG TPA: L,D-transpeptidase [Anaerolineae bacterium]
MSDSSTSLLRQAQTAIKTGRRQQARQLLQQAVRQNPQDYQAWLWLASVAPSPGASLDYVRRAEMLMPDDRTVQKARAWAERRLQTATTQPTHQPPIQPSKPPTWPKTALWAIAVVVTAFTLLLAGLLLWNGFSPFVAVGQIRAAISMPVANLPSSDGPAAASQEVVANPVQMATPVPAQSGASVPAAELSLAPRLQPKNLVLAGSHEQVSEPRPTWTVTPLPTNTPVPTPTFVPTFTSSQRYEAASRPFGVGPTERWVDVNLASQTLTAYEGDEPVFSTLISSGTWDHPTVTGQFRIWLRYESQTMDGRLLGYDYYLENVPYVMYFYQDYALHGTYWHNNFGTPMSHGCVNMPTADAAWLFNWASIGTVVSVH